MSKTVYYRMKASKDAKGNWRADESGPWQYLAVPDGRGKPPEWLAAAKEQAAKGGRGFQFRLPSGAFSEPVHKTVEDAIAAADPQAAKRSNASKPVENPDGSTSIRAAVEDYLNEAHTAMRRKRTLQQYELILGNLLETLPRSVQNVKQLATRRALTDHMSTLVRAGYSAKSVVNHLTTIASMLNRYAKETNVAEPLTLVTLPKVKKTRPKAYSREEIGKLFAAMTPAQSLQYLFFLVTGCREQEVQYATWDDIDFKAKSFRVTGEGKPEWEGPKNHEERTVLLTSELVDLLRAARKTAVSNRWIFVNSDGNPQGHFLRHFKAIAKKAGLNCGRCTSKAREGHDEHRHEVDVTCATHPICEKHYLHRLRKTAATFWLRGGQDIMKIKTWLGHTSLNVTQIYLSDEMQGTEQVQMDKIYSQRA